MKNQPDPYQQQPHYYQQSGVPPPPYNPNPYAQQPNPYQYSQNTPYQQQPPPIYSGPSTTSSQYADGNIPGLPKSSIDGRPYYDEGSSMGSTEHYIKFTPTPKYQDLFFLILWVVDVIAVIAIFVFGIVMRIMHKEESSDKVSILPDEIDGQLLLDILFIAGICTGSATVIAVIWMILVQVLAKQLIWISLVLAIVLNFAGGAFLVFSGYLFLGILMFAIGLLTCFLFFLWRSRIPFATEMLILVARLSSAYPAMIRVGVLGLLFQIGWVYLWTVTITLSQQYSSAVLTYILSVFLVFSLYWTGQVLKNVVHVTVGGTVATWYFTSSNPTNVPVNNPTLASLKRATTTSLGSICLGSMIVAILKTLRTMAYWFRTSDTDNWVFVILALIAECILACVEGLLQYFNMYAFAQVAIYGKSYIQAAKDTWRLIHSHGIEAIINDDLIQNVTLLVTLVSGVIVGVIGGVLGYVEIRDYWILMALMGFFIGVLVVSVPMEIVESSVIVIFVCFAEDPAALQRNCPEVYQRLASTYGSRVDVFDETGNRKYQEEA